MKNYERYLQLMEETSARFESSGGSRAIIDTQNKKGTRTLSLSQVVRELNFREVSLDDFLNNPRVKEQIIAQSDLMPVHFLSLGATCAKAVGKVNVIFEVTGEEGFGTGFMIAPNLMMTNNHVLESKSDAQSSFIEFDYELDEQKRNKTSVSFALEPDKFFITDKDLDFTIVYVSTDSVQGGRKVSEFGFLQLIEETGKTAEGKSVSIIQHPSGNRKSIALRNNEITSLLDDFIQYTTDTEPGSSGAPVFNDLWQVVAIHHSGVPKRNKKGQALNKNGQPWSRSEGEENVDWIANEGVRISRIMQWLRGNTPQALRMYLKDVVNFDAAPQPAVSVPTLPPTPDVFLDTNAADAAINEYYQGISGNESNLFDLLHDLLTKSHKNALDYQPSRHLYPDVDLHPDGRLRSIYSNKAFDREELLLLDAQVDAARRTRFMEMTSTASSMTVESFTEALNNLENDFPYNCEHVVPQSWFSKRNPMRGDLHHLFTCEVRCNSFRSNTPFTDFADYEPNVTPFEKVINECGKSEGAGFEPENGKGIAARATLYFLLRYPNGIGNRLDERRVKVLLSWHEKFPVTNYERSRNGKVQGLQGNRNPLIDHPEWASSIDFEQGL